VQGPGALAVQPEVLGARHRAQHFRQLGAEQAQPEGVRVRPLAESLVGHVDEGRQLSSLNQREQLAPLLLGQIGARRVVAGSVHQYHRSRRQTLESRGHLAEPHPTGRGIEVRVALEPQPAAGEQRCVVCPGGSAHVHHGVRVGRADELRAEPQCSAAAGCLYAAHPAGRERRMCRPEHQLLHGLVEARIAGRPHVRLGRLACDQGALGAAHHLEHRRVALSIAIHADSQVDLVRVRIGAKRRHQAEYRVGNDRGKMLEHVLLRWCGARGCPPRQARACAPPRIHHPGARWAWRPPARRARRTA